MNFSKIFFILLIVNVYSQDIPTLWSIKNNRWYQILVDKDGNPSQNIYKYGISIVTDSNLHSVHKNIKRDISEINSQIIN